MAEYGAEEFPNGDIPVMGAQYSPMGHRSISYNI